MQITDAERPAARTPARDRILSAAAWYDPDSVTFVGLVDDRPERAADEPAPPEAEPDRTPVLEPA
jgi:hypothetical protein